MQPNGTRLVGSSSNLLLRRLAPSDQQLIEPFAEQVTVTRGTTLIDPSEEIDALFFPETAIFSIEEQVDPSRRVEVAVIGREGLLGWPALLGAQRATHSVIAQLASGSALRIPLAPLRRAGGAGVWEALLRFVQAIMVQMARTIASQLHDSVDRRLARWLLMRHDRLGGDILLTRHDEIAHNLNVRRATITDGLHILEGDHMIRCTRGKILIRDRRALEACAGDAYGLPEACYRSLIAPFGKSVQAQPG